MTRTLGLLLCLVLISAVLLSCVARTGRPALELPPAPPGEARPDGAVRLTEPATPVSDQNPGYPRLANYFCSADVLSATLELARWDTDILIMDTQAYPDIFDLNTLRQLNPQITLLAYVDPVEVNLNAFEYDPSNHNLVEHQMIQGIDSGWWLLDPGSVLSTDVDATQAEIPVGDTSAFTAWLTLTEGITEPAYALVDGEHMRILDVLTDTLVVLRGVFSTPTAHLAGARIATHVVYWPGTWELNMTDNCPLDGQGRRWNDYVAQFMHDQVMSTGVWNGLYYDCVWGTVSWLNWGNVDADNDGARDDPAGLDGAWRNGLRTLLADSRALEGPAVPIVGNAEPSNPFYGSLNGILNEQFPFLYGWHPTMAGYFTWNGGGRPPVLNVVDASPPNIAPGDPDPGAQTNYRWMRFGLTSALMSDGFYGYDGGDWDHQEVWWYDEYDNAGQGQGYLGQPLGLAVEAGATGVSRDGFEGGNLGPYQLLPPAGALTANPDEVISGSYSVKGAVSVSTTQWVDYLASDPSLLPLTPGTTCTVEFDYRVLAGSLDSSFYFLAWSESGQDERGNLAWYDLAGARGTRRITLALGPYNDYALLWGIEFTGTIVVDNIRVLEGEGGVWRRDFDRGLALVNPTGQARTVDLGEPFRKIAGVQDPLHNDGAPVTQLTIAPYDGYVLLREATAYTVFLPLVWR